MKKAVYAGFFISVLGFCAGLSPAAAGEAGGPLSTPGITGMWAGRLQTLHLVFKISRNDLGLLVTVFSPDQTDQAIPTDKASFQDGSLHFEIKDISASFDGRLSRDGSKLTGNWTQRATLPLTLTRTDKFPVVERIPASLGLDGWKAYLDPLVKPLIKGGWMKAVVVGATYRGQTRVWGYGHWNSRGTRIPNGDTEFEVGSITKLFTYLMLSDMVQKGQMKLDDPAQKYLPAGVTMPSLNGRQVTLLELANHSSGLPHDPDDLDFTLPSLQGSYSLPRLYRYLSRVHLVFEPGTGAHYSNTGVGLLGDLIASKSGMDYEDYLQQLVCRPLGLKDTGVAWTQGQLARAAQGYKADGEAIPLWQWPEPSFVAAGAIHSTANDLLKLAGELSEAAGSPLDGVATGETAEQLFWGPVVSHDGQTYGFNSSFTMDRRQKTALVVWGDCGNLKTSSLAFEIKKLFRGLKPEPLDLPRLTSLTDEQLKDYMGRYAVEQPNTQLDVPAGMLFIVTSKDGHLVALWEKNKEKQSLYPMANGNFYSKAMACPISFVRDGKNQVVGAAILPNLLGIGYTLRKLDGEGKPLGHGVTLTLPAAQ